MYHVLCFVQSKFYLFSTLEASSPNVHRTGTMKNYLLTSSHLRFEHIFTKFAMAAVNAACKGKAAFYYTVMLCPLFQMHVIYASKFIEECYISKFLYKIFYF